MKRFLIIFLLVAITAATGYIFYSKNINNTKVTISTFDAIPNAVSVFGYTEDIYELLSTIDSLPYKNAITNAPWHKKLLEQTTYINNIAKTLDSVGTSFSIGSPIFGLAQIGNGEIGVLTIADLTINQNLSLQILTKSFEKLNVKISQYDYNNFEIFSINNYNKQSNFTFTIHNNLFIGSFSTPLVEQSLDAIQDPTSANKSVAIEKLRKESKADSEIHLFIHIAEIGNIAQAIVKSNYNDAFEQLEQLGEWMYVSVNFLENSVSLNGYSLYKEQGESVMNNLSSSSPTDFTVDEVLPNSTAYCRAILSSNNSIFETDNLEKSYLFTWVDQQYAHFILESFDTKLLDRAGIAVKATSTDEALLNLAELNKGFNTVDTVEEHFIYQLTDATVLNQAFPNGLITFENAFYTTLGNYVFFTNNINTLKSCIQKNEEGNVLSKEIDYRDFMEKSSSKTNYLVYVNNEKFKILTQDIFSKDLIAQNAVSKFTFQLANINEQFFTTSNILYSKSTNKKTSKVWEVQLKANGAMKPVMVKNHDNNSTEILIQDVENNLYLINPSGEILFERTLEEQIMGTVYQVDYYSNGKLQYVFNTATKVYVMDRLGRNVADFPRKLPANATSGMLVVNYDGKEKYRYFIPCENNSIYGYKVDFLPLEGWSPLANTGKINFPIKHNVINGKDFISYVNDKGNFIALNRKGELRFEPIELPAVPLQNFKFTNNKFHNGINGQYIAIDEFGKVEKINIIDSTYQRFALAKSQLQNYTAYAFANENNFEFLKNEIQKLAAFETEAAIKSIETVYLENSLWFIISTTDKTYFIDELGSLYNNFPLSLSAPLSFVNLNNNNKNYYITQTFDSKISLYQIKVAI